MATKNERTVRAKAKCASFEIEIVAVIKKTGGLAADEVRQVQRKLRQNLSTSVSTLPFAHVYAHEVRVR